MILLSIKRQEYNFFKSFLFFFYPKQQNRQTPSIANPTINQNSILNVNQHNLLNKFNTILKKNKNGIMIKGYKRHVITLQEPHFKMDKLLKKFHKLSYNSKY